MIITANLKFLTYIFSAMICFLIYVLMESILTYRKFESISSTSLNIANSLQLPAVTICSTSYMNSKSLRQNFPQSVSQQMFQYFIPLLQQEIQIQDIPENFTSYLRSLSLSDLYLQVEASRTFVQCQIAEIDVNCSKYMTKIITDTGICSTFHSNEFIKSHAPISTSVSGFQGGFSFVLNVEPEEGIFYLSYGAGLRVLVHDPLIHPLMGEHEFVVAPGNEVHAGITRSEVHYMKKPYSMRDCVSTNELKDYRKYSLSEEYSPESCYLKCTNSLLNCNCSLYTFNNSCSVYDLVTCAAPNSAAISKMEQRERCSHCLPLCSQTTFDVKLSHMGYPNANGIETARKNNFSAQTQADLQKSYLRLMVFYNSLRYAVTKQLPAVESQDLWSQFGGLMGLCLGASLLSVLECLEFVIVLIARKCFNNKTEISAKENSNWTF